MLRVRFRGDALAVRAGSLAEAQAELAARTGVPAARMKLVARGLGRLRDDAQLAEALARGAAVQMVGSTAEEAAALEEAQEAAAHGTSAAREVWNDLDVDYDEVRREREHQAAVREREARLRAAEKTEWRFHGYRALPQFRDAQRAREILERLGTDPGFVAVMRKHRWKVGVLSEMYPDGKVGVDPVCVLGVNINKGQEISLRLRTDDLQGFRKYDEVKKVLCHELSHMVHSEHDAEFYKLMRVIEKEQVALDWRTSGGRVVGGDHFLNAALVAKPKPPPQRPQGGVHRLGGSQGAAADDPRRAAATAATARRLEGASGPDPDSSPAATNATRETVESTASPPTEPAPAPTAPSAEMAPEAALQLAQAPVPQPPSPPPSVADLGALSALVDSDVRQTLQGAVGQVVERNEPSVALRALGMLRKVLGNVVRDPSNEKFQRLRLTNAKFKETIGSALGARHVLTSVGWTLQAEPGSGENVLVFVRTDEALAASAFAWAQADELVQLAQMLADT